MRLVVARVNHETNTFSPVPTPLEAFDPRWDEHARASAQGTRTAMGAFLDVAAELGADVSTPVFATANPSGPVEDAAYEAMSDAIVSAVAKGCDAVLLDLHGAMVTEGRDDGEGELLERVREAAPRVPVAVALDLHGNVTQRMIDHADIVVSFKTYPHVDMYETGERAGRLLARTLNRQIAPVMAWRRLPMMTHTLRVATASGAMQRCVQAAAKAEHDGLLSVSVLPGFALADIPAPCLSVIAIADGDSAAASAVAERIAGQAWDDRAAFIYPGEPLSRSIARARDLDASSGGSKPILLLDHGDNCMSGGTCDDMDVLAAALEQGLANILVGPVCDPEAVDRLIATRPGVRTSIAVGGKRALVKLGITKRPLMLEGSVRAICDGRFTVSGPTYTGQTMEMGRTVLFDAGAVRLVITERTQEPLDIGVFACVGEDIARARYVLLKSRMYCRPVFEPLARGVVECDSRGVTSSDFGLFPYRRLTRPVYPLDPDATRV
jgi:microcystin degradation protein MlrC